MFHPNNVLGSVLGASTGSFDNDGELHAAHSLSGSDIALKYPRYSFDYALKTSDRVSTEAGLGGTTPIYSASFNTIAGQQDYDLQDIISTTSTTDTSSPFYGKLGTSGDKRITVRKVFYKTPNAMWRFFGYYG